MKERINTKIDWDKKADRKQGPTEIGRMKYNAAQVTAIISKNTLGGFTFPPLFMKNKRGDSLRNYMQNDPKCAK